MGLTNPSTASAPTYADFTARSLLLADGAAGVPDRRRSALLGSAARVLCDPQVLQYSCPTLGLLGVDDSHQLFPTALSQLEAVLAEDAAKQPTDSALHALSLAAFTADCVMAAGAAAGLAQISVRDEQSVPPQQPAALQRLSGARQEQMQSQLLETAVQLVPAELAAVDAALQHRLWSRNADELHDKAAAEARGDMSRIGSFCDWLGRTAAESKHAVAGLTPYGTVTADVTEAWFVLQYRLLQLWATHPLPSGGTRTHAAVAGSSEVWPCCPALQSAAAAWGTCWKACKWRNSNSWGSKQWPAQLQRPAGGNPPCQ